jgi:hypothetical protein
MQSSSLTTARSPRGAELRTCKAPRRVSFANQGEASDFYRVTFSRQGGLMKSTPQVSIEPRTKGRWAVQIDGTTRADSVHDTKTAAVARGRQLARNKHAELVIKNTEGKIRGKDSHGKDPHPPRG